MAFFDEPMSLLQPGGCREPWSYLRDEGHCYDNYSNRQPAARTVGTTAANGARGPGCGCLCADVARCIDSCRVCAVGHLPGGIGHRPGDLGLRPGGVGRLPG